MANLIPFIALLSVASGQLIAPRLIDGVPADTLKRFPHHVTIRTLYPDNWDGKAALCGGSILNDRWILTSTYCVSTYYRIELQFERLYVNNATGSYSVVVNRDAVHIYPTNWDDIAMIKLPFRLVFSDLIKPITISTQAVSQLEGKLLVLPGFDVFEYFNGEAGTHEQLNYAMLSVTSTDNCTKVYGSVSFDEYSQFCTLGYKNNPNAPCYTEYGSGLIAGWPAKPQLVGIESTNTYDCSNIYPTMFTNVAKYLWWINSLIEQ